MSASVARSLGVPPSARLHRLHRLAARAAPLAGRALRDMRIALVVGLGMLLAYLPRAWAALGDVDPRVFALLAARVFAGWVGTGVAIVVVERWAARRWTRLWPKMAAVAGACSALQLCVALIQPYARTAFNTVSYDVGLNNSQRALQLELLWSTVLCAIGTTAYLDRAASRAAADERLAALRREQQLVRRRLVEARLQVLQTRVDPPFFFAMLEAVRDRYAVDPVGAEALLEQLTAFLRAALPTLRTAMSTIGQEAELVGAYATLLTSADGVGLQLVSRVDAEATALPFPAGVLLPLLQHLLQPAKATVSVDLHVLRAANGLRLRLQTGGSRPPAIDGVRRTLADVYDGSATLGLRGGLGGTWVVDIEVQDA